MTNFFTKSDGTQIEQNNEFVNSGIQAIIPENTKLHANILEATWEAATQYNNQHILIKWYITEKGQYNGFIVNQKVAVLDDKASKADKAKEMLMAIDSNCKGELFKLAQAGKFDIGNNMQLARALAGGSALVTVAEYEMESNTGGDHIRGNWIRAVSPVSKAQKQEDKHIERQAQQTQSIQNDDPYDDNIPF